MSIHATNPLGVYALDKRTLTIYHAPVALVEDWPAPPSSEPATQAHGERVAMHLAAPALRSCEMRLNDLIRCSLDADDYFVVPGIERLHWRGYDLAVPLKHWLCAIDMQLGETLRVEAFDAGELHNSRGVPYEGPCVALRISGRGVHALLSPCLLEGEGKEPPIHPLPGEWHVGAAA